MSQPGANILNTHQPHIGSKAGMINGTNRSLPQKNQGIANLAAESHPYNERSNPDCRKRNYSVGAHNSKIAQMINSNE